MSKRLSIGRILFTVLVFSLLALPAMASGPVKFGVPSWPGVTVKSEVASQLIRAMGYEVEQTVASPSIIFKAMTLGELNAYLGGWSPVEDPMIDPLVEKGEIIRVGANIEEAVTALVVPSFVAEAGVTSIEDLAAHKDKFESTIYGIESGSGANNDIQEAIDANAAGLGDWELAASSTASMLAQVQSLSENKRWAVFWGWEPHWMNAVMDLHYLQSETPATKKIGASVSVVYTITSNDLPETNPQAYAFLEQLKVPSDVQSQWVYEYRQQGKEPEDLAPQWIKANIDGLVGQWLEGVRAANGEPALKVVRAAFK